MRSIGLITKKHNYASGALILATAGMVSKLIGAIYRIPLTNILGAEGIGVYQLVFPIYALMLTLSSSAIPTAISRMISERNALKDEAGKVKILKASAILLIVLGGMGALILTLLAVPISSIQGNELLKFGYYAIAPAIFIVACSAFFKGWFQGNMNMTPTATAQIVEQIAKMIFGLVFAKLLLPSGLIKAVVGALIGITIAEACSLTVMGILYMCSRPKKKTHAKIEISICKEVLKVSLPIALSGLIFPLMQFVDSILIVNLLKFYGEANATATAQYGLLTGAINSLINMPVVVTLALAVAIVPIVAAKRAEKDAKSIKERATFALKLSYLIAMPCFFGALILAKPILHALYPALSAEDLALSVKLLQTSSISIVLLSSLQIYTSMLQALGRTISPILNLSIAALVKVTLNIILIKYLGILGSAIASICAYALAMTLNSIYFKKLLGGNKKLLKSISKITLNSVIMSMIVILFSYLIHNIYISIIVSTIVGAIIYGILAIVFKVLDNSELIGFPFGRGLIKISEKIHGRRDK